MCIAILNTKNTLSFDTIKNSWDNNNQGAGLLYAANNRLNVYKSYEFTDFYNEYKRVRKTHTGTIVLHFRIATSGHKKWINLHPFIVNNSLGFVHNGIISGLGDDQHSDTYQFNSMLQKLPSNFLGNEVMREFIREYIGGSKLIFLDHKGNHTIINERAGHWKDGNWYSNNSYACNLDYYYFGNKKVNKPGKVSKTEIEETVNNNLNFIESMYVNCSDYEIQRYCDLMNTSLEDNLFIEDLTEATQYVNSYDLENINNFLEAEYYQMQQNEYKY